MRRSVQLLLHCKSSVLRRAAPLIFHPSGTCRHLMKLLNSIPNLPDFSRISKIGPDAACAEWILKLGGAIRFEGDKEWIRNYNFLPSVINPDYKPGLILDEIDASGTSVMWFGFLSLRGTSVRKIKLHDCQYLDNKCMLGFKEIEKSLEHLQVSRCPKVTDRGLVALHHCSKLKTLVLYELNGVKDINGTVQSLRLALPHCQILDSEDPT